MRSCPIAPTQVASNFYFRTPRDAVEFPKTARWCRQLFGAIKAGRNRTANQALLPVLSPFTEAAYAVTSYSGPAPLIPIRSAIDAEYAQATVLLLCAESPLLLRMALKRQRIHQLFERPTKEFVQLIINHRIFNEEMLKQLTRFCCFLS
uniref:Uncharacterized protein n=1 Tax=Trichuris muris TaxID=70415 RepID=A0A5S6QIV3_TRIMR